jgi:hypothetical protein
MSRRFCWLPKSKKYYLIPNVLEHSYRVQIVAEPDGGVKLVGHNGLVVPSLNTYFNEPSGAQAG